MSVPLDPARGLPLAQVPTANTPVAQTLAELALQRQASLLGAAASPPHGTGGALDAAQPLGPLPLPAAVPDKLSLSAQAQASLGNAEAAKTNAQSAQRADSRSNNHANAAASAVRPVSAPGGGALSLLPSALRSALPAAAAPAASPAVATPALPPWPSSGVPAPLRAMVAALVQQLTAPVQPQRVLAVQPWPAALLPLVDGDAAGPGLAPLQTWLVRQGVVQTPQGERGVAISLRVPQPWLQALAQRAAATAAPAASPTPAPTLAAAFAGKPQALQSGTWALVLQAPGTQAPRTSALLSLDFAPPPGSAVYGRDAPLLRQDAWMLMAALQASGPRLEEEDAVHQREAALCQTPGCPYQGRAACEQPFCLALRQVLPVDVSPSV